MKNLNQLETVLSGHWISKDGAIVADDISKRIEYLTQNVLKQIATSDDGWDKLFLDEVDSRYWELLYVNSDLHGAGAPVLQCISKTDVVKKYRL